MTDKKITDMPTIGGADLADNDLLTIVDISSDPVYQNRAITKYELSVALRTGLIPETRAVLAGVGLAGGGDLSADRSFSVDITGLTDTSTVVGATDYLMLYDASEATVRKVLVDNLGIGAGAGLSNAYTGITDGSSTAAAQGSTTLKLRSADGLLTIDVTDNDATHGDNALFQVHPELIAAVGTIATGVWQGDPIGVAYGGTGATSGPAALANLGGVPTSRQVASGEGLSGGGTLVTDRTLALDVNSLTAEASVNGATDFLVIYDASAGAHRKVLISDLGFLVSVTPGYAHFTDGTNTADASEDDTLKIRAVGSGLSVVVTNDDATHGDNVLFTLDATQIDHDALQNVDQDGHSQYALLAGRAGGQTLIGGSAATEDLLLGSTAHASKGVIVTQDTLQCNKLALFETEVLNTPLATSDAIDWPQGNKQRLNLASATGTVTLTFTDPSGPASLMLRIDQGVTARDITWPAAVRWDDYGQPDWAADTSRTRLAAFYFDGTTYWAQVSGAYS